MDVAGTKRDGVDASQVLFAREENFTVEEVGYVARTDRSQFKVLGDTPDDIQIVLSEERRLGRDHFAGLDDPLVRWQGVGWILGVC